MRAQELQHWLDTAREAAARAGEIIRRYGDRGFSVRHKADRSPVTEADEAAEQAIRELITERHPEHRVVGEELGGTIDPEGVNWLVDPLDGTKSFVRGTPYVSTQIAVMVGGQVQVGVSAATFTGETAWAVAGGGAFVDGRTVRVSEVGELSRAHVSTGNLRSLAQRGSHWQALAGVVKACERIRGYGDFAHYHMLATGQIDAVIESDVNVLDIAALSLIVQEAGGRFTDLAGQPVGTGTRSVLAATPSLHAQLLECFGA